MILGPYHYKTKAGSHRWRVRIGSRSKSFADEAAALAFVGAERATTGEPDPLTRQPALSGRGMWLDTLDLARRQVVSKLAAAELDVLQAGRVLSSLATAASKFVSDDETRAEVEELRKLVAQIRTARKHGTRLAPADQGVAGASSTTDPLH